MEEDKKTKKKNYLSNILLLFLILLGTYYIAAFGYNEYQSDCEKRCRKNLKLFEEKFGEFLMNVNFQNPYIKFEEVIGAGFLEEMPVCPSGGRYSRNFKHNDNNFYGYINFHCSVHHPESVYNDQYCNRNLKLMKQKLEVLLTLKKDLKNRITMDDFKKYDLHVKHKCPGGAKIYIEDEGDGKSRTVSLNCAEHKENRKEINVEKLIDEKKICFNYMKQRFSVIKKSKRSYQTFEECLKKEKIEPIYTCPDDGEYKYVKFYNSWFFSCSKHGCFFSRVIYY